MRLLAIYRPNSEHSRIIETFIRDFKYQHVVDPGMLEVLDVDTRQGADTAALYDVIQYPTLMVLSDDGQVVKTWEGDNLPLMDEVAGYIHS